MMGSIGGDVLAVLLFLLFQACGLCAARAFLPEEGGGVKLLFGSVCGTVMLQWFPVPFAFLLGFGPAAHILAAALAAGCAVSCLVFLKRRGGLPKIKHLGESLQKLASQKFLWVILAMTLFTWFLIWKSFLFQNGKIFSSQATYGDMSMHLSFITSLARQGDFPPDYSLLPGVRLSYPFLSDSVSSSLYLCGASLKLAYFLPMAFAAAQVFFAFYLFAARLLRSAGKAALAWIFFFFNSGFGFVYFLNGERSFSDLFHGFYQTPTNLTEKSIRWVNVVVDMMLPQRATLFGWAVLFPLLYLLYRAVFENKREYFVRVGVLAGLLPMIHTHSFLAAALVCGMWLLFSALRALSWERRAALTGKILVAAGLPCMAALYQIVRRQSDQDFLLWAVCIAAGLFVLALAWLLQRCARQMGWKLLLSTWGALLGTVCLLALPQLLIWTFRQAGNGGFLRGGIGWIIAQREDGYLWFYLKNLGLTGILSLAGLLFAKPREFTRYAPALLIWLVAELVLFQPNPYDNNKLLYVAFAFLCCAAADFAAKLLQLLKSRGLRAAAGAVCVFFCTVSAALTMGREAVARYEIYGDGAIALCQYVEENLPADAVILTDTRHNNEIAALSGRNIVCGSSAYLFFHGLPYARNEWAVGQMYETPRESWKLFQEFDVDYILVSDFEHSSYQVDEEVIGAMFPRVYDDGVRVLYQVTGKGDGP